MKVLSLLLLLVSLACLVSSLPDEAVAEVQHDVQGTTPSGGPTSTTAKPPPAKATSTSAQPGNPTGNPKGKPTGKPNLHWKDDHYYCVKKDRWGHQCVVASSERSPCSRDGTKTGCNGHGSQCTGCTVNHQKSGWMYNQMNGWCRRQGGWIVHNMGNWKPCQQRH